MAISHGYVQLILSFLVEEEEESNLRLYGQVVVLTELLTTSTALNLTWFLLQVESCRTFLQRRHRMLWRVRRNCMVLTPLDVTHSL